MQVLARGEVVVAERLVADERELAANRAAVAAEVVPEHGRGARAQRQEPGEQPQQRRLAGAVRPREQHDLALVDVEIGAGERRKTVEQAHGRADAHDGQRGPPRPGSGTARVYGRRPDVGEPLPGSRRVAPVVSTIVRRTAASLGRMLVTVGLLILLFVAYQLWGTGIFTARAQNDLERQFNAQLRDNPTLQTTTVDDRRAPTAVDDPDARPRPDDGPDGRAGRQRGRPGRAHPHPPDRRRPDLRAGHRPRRPAEGPRPLPGVADAGTARQRRDRRPPHDPRRSRSTT